jgi:hypothetical protein
MTERYAHLSKGALHNATANFEKAIDHAGQKSEAAQVVSFAGSADHGK